MVYEPHRKTSTYYRVIQKNKGEFRKLIIKTKDGFKTVEISEYMNERRKI